jgi:hypothetical protein
VHGHLRRSRSRSTVAALAVACLALGVSGALTRSAEAYTTNLHTAVIVQFSANGSPLALRADAAVAMPAAHLELKLSPAIVPLGRKARIVVTGVRASSVGARLVGASLDLGRPLPWTPLHPGRGGWTGKLAAPEFLGVYPVELRIGHGLRIIRAKRSRLYVFAPGTFAEPTFGTPEAVARWWVQTLPASLHANLSALKRWQTPAFDHRDPRLHQLLVVAYVTGASDSFGMFVTAVRGTPKGRWRMLEATVQP